MKPTKSIYILLSLFLMFSCDDKEEELPNELSLDWILLKKGVDEYYVVNCCYSDWIISNYNINCCENSNGCDDYNEWYCSFGLMTFDTTITYKVKPKMDSLGNTIENPYWYIVYLSYEYLLYWNKDLLVCNGNNCDEESWNFSNYDYDIVIPSYIRSNDYSIPLPLDTTMMIGSKSISFEKMGWLDRENDNSLGYITYLRNEDYLQTDGDDIDISNWIVVDYQRKE